MTKAAFVTDGDGEVFRRMAVDAIEDDVGIGLLQQIKEWVKTIKSRGLLERSVEEENRPWMRRSGNTTEEKRLTEK